MGLLIAALHLMPGGSMDMNPRWLGLGADKWSHGVMFCLLSMTFLVAVGKAGGLRKWWWVILLGSTAYGGLLEAIQGLLPTGRAGDAWDLLADGVGVMAAWPLFRLVYGFWPGSSRRFKMEG
jgi:aminopeptidase YwaD